MKVLVVKLSSLGDVVHAMPALQDMQIALAAGAAESAPTEALQIDWVVERAFAPLVRRCTGLRRTIECDIRTWRRSFWTASTRSAWREFLGQLREQAYDAVIDLQGLTKSAVVARLARLAPGGKRYGLANRTEGSSYEAPARWLADVAIRIEPRIHVVERARELCARALGYAVPKHLSYGLRLRSGREGAHGATESVQAQDAAGESRPLVLLVHGSSRADKLWPEPHWVELGRRIIEDGYRIALVHGSDDEEARSRRIARAQGKQSVVWPRLELDALLDRMSRSRGVVGVDSGLSHLAVALDLPHVQIYNLDTAWRTGPSARRHQVAIVADPTPALEPVWNLWQQVLRA